jgi:glycosyltransferase involved in cell wall biosynthesis
MNQYSYPPEKIVRIRNGWDGQPHVVAYRGGRKTIVCVANFRAQKDHATLLLAFKQVLEQIPEARLLLVGDGPLKFNLIEMSKELRISNAVSFSGPVDNVWDHLARASVFALASVYEPLGIAVLEAMAAGLPVVATDVGGIPELVRHGANGLLVSPGNPRALALALLELLNNTVKAERLGKTAALDAAQFRTQKMLEEYFDLYEELIR